MTKIKAAIIDLDGVITQTATLHAQAWKKMFDAYNEKRQDAGKVPFLPYFIGEDYPRYLDGMPRYDGVANFLHARGIELPKGTPDDRPGKETICGLGNWKNEIYHQLIEEEGVEVLDWNVSKLREWKSEGIRLAVISSSKNCEIVLKAAGLTHLFEARVDGVVSAERGLKGKPMPDIFLEAARELQVTPSEALIVEDSLAGVEAGKRGGFALVIGIGKNEGAMKDKGADKVVADLSEIELNNAGQRKSDKLPSAIEKADEITGLIQNQPVILCLDYDGTLTPIVQDYQKAIISDDMRALVREVAALMPVAVVSGRDFRFIKRHVNLEEVYYAGSHGFEIHGPDGFHYEMEDAKNLLPVFDRLENELQEKFKGMEGVAIERKKYAIAVHYRNATPKVAGRVKEEVGLLVENEGEMVAGKGKKVMEIKPAIEWHKGKAVELIKAQIEVNGEEDAVIYLGDDLTDEDAFRSIKQGAGILVGSHGEPTAANYRLKDVGEVRQFLQKIKESR